MIAPEDGVGEGGTESICVISQCQSQIVLLLPCSTMGVFIYESPYYVFIYSRSWAEMMKKGGWKQEKNLS